MVTALDRPLKRAIEVDGASYTVLLDAEGLSVTPKGKRKPVATLRWHELVSGEAALATALNASLASNRG